MTLLKQYSLVGLRCFLTYMIRLRQFLAELLPWTPKNNSLSRNTLCAVYVKIGPPVFYTVQRFTQPPNPMLHNALQWARHASKLPLHAWVFGPDLTRSHGPTQVHFPNDISIGSDAFAGLTSVTDKRPPHHGNTTTTIPQPFYGLFSGTMPAWAGARRELLDFMMQGKINRGRDTDHPDGRHSIRTNQCPPPPSPIPHHGNNRPHLRSTAMRPKNEKCTNYKILYNFF